MIFIKKLFNLNFIEFSHQFESFFIKFQQFAIKCVLYFIVVACIATSIATAVINAVIDVVIAVLTVKFTVNKWGFINSVNWYKNRISAALIDVFVIVLVTGCITICVIVYIVMCIIITLYLIKYWMVVNFSLFVNVIEY